MEVIKAFQVRDNGHYTAVAAIEIKEVIPTRVAESSDMCILGTETSISVMY